MLSRYGFEFEEKAGMAHWGYGGTNPSVQTNATTGPIYLGVSNGYKEEALRNLGAAVMSWSSYGMENGTWSSGLMFPKTRIYPNAGNNRKTGLSLRQGIN